MAIILVSALLVVLVKLNIKRIQNATKK